jgi:hypothetical protein
MLHGKGDQYWMTEEYEKDRRKALKDRSKYSDTQLDKVDLLDKPHLGGGRTDPDNWEVWQFPFPMDQSIRRRQKVDIRKVDPAIGDKDD